jgi:hypothetical protein
MMRHKESTMPEFQLDLGGQRKRFAELDAFTQGYVEALFWTLDEALGERSLDDLDESAWEAALQDCDAFQQTNELALCAAYETTDSDYSPRSAGIDFYLTRNGHGAGFWDRGLGSIGDELSKDAKPYGTADLYLGDDEKLYLA